MVADHRHASVTGMGNGFSTHNPVVTVSLPEQSRHYLSDPIGCRHETAGRITGMAGARSLFRAP
jgi:hypothetical protein